jgi:hypothetical protein
VQQFKKAKRRKQLQALTFINAQTICHSSNSFEIAFAGGVPDRIRTRSFLQGDWRALIHFKSRCGSRLL